MYSSLFVHFVIIISLYFKICMKFCILAKPHIVGNNFYCAWPKKSSHLDPKIGFYKFFTFLHGVQMQETLVNVLLDLQKILQMFFFLTNRLLADLPRNSSYWFLSNPNQTQALVLTADRITKRRLFFFLIINRYNYELVVKKSFVIELTI
jgi:hypothetical protein